LGDGFGGKFNVARIDPAFRGLEGKVRFTKKPVAVEAVRFWNGDGPNTICECLNFIGERKADFDEEKRELLIYTLEGVMHVSDGDWIIRGVSGEYYPCKPDIFALTYDEVQP
jgi:hypothetical protein